MSGANVLPQRVVSLNLPHKCSMLQLSVLVCLLLMELVLLGCTISIREQLQRSHLVF